VKSVLLEEAGEGRRVKGIRLPDKIVLSKAVSLGFWSWAKM